MKKFCKDPLWDWELTWNSTNPDFTVCFEESVLLVLPCLLLWLLTPYEVYRIKSNSKHPLPWSLMNIFKLALAVLLCIVSFVDLINALFRHFDKALDAYPVESYGAFIKLCTFVLVTTLLWQEKKKGIPTSGPLFVFWLLLVIGFAFTYRTLWTMVLNQTEGMDKISYIIKVAYVPLVYSQFVLSCFSDAIPSRYLPGESNVKKCPEYSASFLSSITFSWFTSMASLGKKKPLTQKDMWELDEDKKTSGILQRFDKYWKKKAKGKRSEEYDPILEDVVTQSGIFWPMMKAFWKELLLGAFFNLVSASLQFVNPVILDQLITFVGSDQPTWRGYLYVSLMLIASAGDSLCTAQNEKHSYTVAMKFRSCMIAAIYNKSLKLSSYGSKDFTTGEIVNLMAVDTQKIIEFMNRLNFLWVGIFQAIVCIYLLWQQLGLATLAGLAVMLILVPSNGFFTSKVRAIQLRLMKQKDERSKLMNEILNGIKVIKLFSWENFFKETVAKARSEEVKQLKIQAYLWGGIVFSFSSTPFLVSLASFVTYVLIDSNNVLDPNKAFVSVSLFNLLRVPLNVVPIAFSFLAMAMISIKRINKYLISDELDTNNVSRNHSETEAVTIEDGTFSWGKDSPSILTDIHWTVPHRKLVAVVGEVGSGKSSLLAALLGDLDKRSGYVNVSGSLAYVPQQAWILNETLRQNIIFAKPMERGKYRAVLEACALEPDLKILDGGDMCEIGEKGINLSGGQKQRVSLARAVYSDADIYLLDDPLSAVDSHVSKHLFDKVIGPKGILKSKTRIIVTHRITILPQVDEIVVLKNGRISEQGTYSELLAKKGDFAEMIVQYLDQDIEDVEDPEEIAVIEDLVQNVRPSLERHFSRTSGDSLSDKPSMASRKRRQSKASSVASQKSITESQQKKSSAKLIEEETSQVGSIKWSVYKDYFLAMGYAAIILTPIAYLLANAFNILTNLWLTEWSEDGLDPLNANNTELRNYRIEVYTALGVGEMAFIMFATFSINVACVRAGILIHDRMLDKILAAPMSFYDTTPLGRILNRFTKEVDTIDVTINFNLRMYIVNLFRAFATIVLIGMNAPLFIVTVIPLAIAYNVVQNYYITTSRQLRRIESVTRSPIYTHFSQTVNGTNSIRAYGVNNLFIKQCYQRVDIHHSANYPSIIAARWLAVRLDFVGYLVVTLAAVFAVASRGTVSPGITGLIISYAMTITGTINMLVKSSTEVETNVVSVERCLEYNDLPSEAPKYIESTKPNPSWPDKGEIKFLNYSTAYRAGLNLVLKNVSFEVKAGEKVGVVGRTGAGKSSLTLALFRIIEPVEGTIIIDDVDISKIGLHELRSRLTIIPQDPVLFSGTIRMNLDPCGEVEDDSRLWEALELANLGNYVRSVESGLSHEITEGGENLSVGQRQLLCLGRAILRKSKILVLDEATAAVDVETDELIQKTIRSEFKDCTVLTIAHRLNTVMDYDKILVLSNGQVSEYDSPQALLENTNSVFYAMAKDANLV